MENNELAELILISIHGSPEHFISKNNWKTMEIQDLGLKCQTPLRLKAWVKEVEGLFYWDFIFEPKNFF